jgi:biotin carboxyl carrier protein
MKFFVHIEGERLQVEVSDGTVLVEGEAVAVDLTPGTSSPVRGVRAGGRSLRLIPRRNGRGDWSMELEGVRWRADVLDPGQEAIRAARKAVGSASGPAPLKAPMPGLVVRVEVSKGDEVTAGQGVVIVEAMKMENELRAPAPGRVKAVRVAEGTVVEKDTILIEFEPLETPGEGTEEGQ